MDKPCLQRINAGKCATKANPEKARRKNMFCLIEEKQGRQNDEVGFIFKQPFTFQVQVFACF